MGQAHIEALKSVTTSSSSHYNSATIFLILLKRDYVPLLTLYNTHNKKKRKMSVAPQAEYPSSPTDSIPTEVMEVDQVIENSKTEERKQSVHSFRIEDSEQENESDKDLIIHSLHESLHIHKEILERIQTEKEEYQHKIDIDRKNEREAIENWRQNSTRELNQQKQRCQELEANINALRQELEAKKEAYQKLEINFYSYVKQIRVTDDDLSTIQPEISHLLSQLNNTCMGLKSKMNRQNGTEFVFRIWKDKVELIKKYMMKENELLDPSYITLFVEKYLIQTLISNILDVPIHIGVTINEPFKEIEDWMYNRNKEWSNRLRQQVCALVVQQPGDEERNIQTAKDNLLEEILFNLSPIYPILNQDSKKIENLILRASKLNLAIKGQEIKIERLPIEEGKTKFDSNTMKATAKGKPNGIVFLSITPTFIAKDEIDNEHGFIVSGKVFCIEENEEVKEEIEIKSIESSKSIDSNKKQKMTEDSNTKENNNENTISN